jgi:hypothetical protein
MPVFHTRTIESILEPVAQQVSYAILLRLSNHMLNVSNIQKALEMNHIPSFCKSLFPHIFAARVKCSGKFHGPLEIGYTTIQNNM